MQKHFARFLRAALILSVVSAMFCGSALAVSVSVKLNASAKVYQSASSSARYVTAPQSLKLTLKSYSSGWGKVSYKGKTGYVQIKYLDLVSPVKAYVSGGASVYKTAGTSDKLGTLSGGTPVYVIGLNGSYAHISDKSGSKKGYVKVSQLTRSRPAASGNGGSGGSSAAAAIPESLRSSTSSSGGSKIEYTIYVAQNLMGAPYAADADPPKTFDCARFTYYCYGKAQSGLLKGSSKSQGYDDSFEKIAYDDLKRGDMVCFDTISDDDLCDHVGIYLGSGYFIHASSAAKKVVLSSLSSGYYKRTFSWGRRIFSS